MDEELFSARHGRKRRMSQSDFAELIWTGVLRLRREGYFDQALDDHPGPTGRSVPPRIAAPGSEFLRALSKSDIYPALKAAPGAFDPTPLSWVLDSDVIWDTLEYLHAEVIAKPARDDQSARIGTYSRSEGQEALRTTVNPDLALHTPPMELVPTGRVVERAPDAATRPIRRLDGEAWVVIRDC